MLHMMKNLPRRLWDNSNATLKINQGESTLQPEYIEESTIDIKKESEYWKPIRLGSASNEGSQCNMTYKVDGIFTTICACTHGYATGFILDEGNHG